MDTSSNEIYSKDHYVVDNSGKLYYRQQMKEAICARTRCQPRTNVTEDHPQR